MSQSWKPSVRTHSILFLFAAACGAGQPASAQDSQLWLAAATRTSLDGPLELHADLNARWLDNVSNFRYFQVRGMLGWRIRPQLLVGGGYSYVRAELASGAISHEHRLFQQLNMPITDIGKARLTARTRLEQRSFSDAPGIALRLRQQVTLMLPIPGAKGVEAILETEPYLLLHSPGSTAAPTGLNQIRTFAGFEIPMGDGVAMDAGYLNQFILAGDDRTNHILSISLSTRF